MSRKIKTEHIKFNKNNSLGSYVNLNNGQVIEFVNQFKQKMIDSSNNSDRVDDNTIHIEPNVYDDINRYNKIKQLLPVQSDMWDWYTNFVGDDVYIEIDYINKTVNVANKPGTDDFNVKYVVSRHPVDDVNEIQNIDENEVIFHINMNRDKTLIAQLDRISDVPQNNFLLGRSIDINLSQNNIQTVNLVAGVNQITFKGVTTGKYNFVLKNARDNVEFQTDIVYLDGHENYDGNVEILDYVVSGYILDSQTNQPISNATIDIFSNGDIWKSETITTSTDGFYSVTIDKDAVEQQGINQFTIRVSADNYVGKLEVVDVIVGNFDLYKDVLLLEGDPTPKVLSITWIDESESVYTDSQNVYQQDKNELEQYIYKYGLIQFDPNYHPWVGAEESYKAVINENVGMPTNVEYQYIQNRANGSNWDQLFETYKRVFDKLIRNYPSAQNVKVGLFIDNSGSLSTYEVFSGLTATNTTYDRDTIENVSDSNFKQYCKWIFDTYSSVTSITLRCAGDEQWIRWTINFIKQMEE